MKIVRLLLISVIIVACSHNNTSENVTAVIASYELKDNDTINRTDARGLRQGHWIIFDNSHEKKSSYTKSVPDSSEHTQPKSLTSQTPIIPIEEGDYKDGKKEGVWRYYETDGALKNTVEYKDDSPISN